MPLSATWLPLARRKPRKDEDEEHRGNDPQDRYQDALPLIVCHGDLAIFRTVMK
jgi:hypothetical protein